MKPFKAALLLGACLGLSACGGTKGGKAVRVSFFGEPALATVIQQRLAEFSKQSGIPVQPEYVPYNAYRERLLVQLAAHAAPDVIWVESETFASLYFGGALLDLDERVKAAGLDLKAYYPGVMDRFTAGGKIYGLPLDTAPLACVYYNRRLFKQAGLKAPAPGWTWADLLAAAKKLRGKTPEGADIWGFQDNYSPDWASAIFSNGGELVDDTRHPTRCLMDSPQAVEAVRFLASLMLEHKVSPSMTAQQQVMPLAQNDFALGRLGMVHTGLWITPFLAGVKGLDWDIAPYPRGPRAKQPGWATGGSAWAISRDARHAEGAWALVKFMSSEETQRALAATGILQPALKAVAASPAFTGVKPPDSKAFLVEAPRYARYRPMHRGWEEAEKAYIQPRLDQVWRGQLDAEAALKAAARDVDEKIFGPGARR